MSSLMGANALDPDRGQALHVDALIDPQHDPASVRAAVSLATPSQTEPQVEPLDRQAIGLRALGAGAKR